MTEVANVSGPASRRSPTSRGGSPIRKIIRRHKAGERVGITSVCSAHPLVVEAALRLAATRGREAALIEATSNQVNQFGGYTGMTPADFRAFVEGIAVEVGYSVEAVVLGGDHLGPNPWAALPAGEAMERAEQLVADYVRAGFGKIHLDCSMSCADDPSPLPERMVAERAAKLAKACEAAYVGPPHHAPVYVIGTEVPVPGGAAEDLEELAVTDPADALATVAMHREVFHDAGLQTAWKRVIATVVQPGVEFDHDKVIDYRPIKAAALSAAIESQPRVVYEAHSTDYQSRAALEALVRDHFAILKVGPGVTFALREALWALDAIDAETSAPEEPAGLRTTALARMREVPANWSKYYHADGVELDLQLQYSLSDRIRYYWPDPAIVAAQDRLFSNLRRRPPALPLLSQYLPSAYEAVRAGEATLDPRDLVVAHITATLMGYDGATNPDV